MIVVDEFTAEQEGGYGQLYKNGELAYHFENLDDAEFVIELINKERARTAASLGTLIRIYEDVISQLPNEDYYVGKRDGYLAVVENLKRLRSEILGE